MHQRTVEVLRQELASARCELRGLPVPWVRRALRRRLRRVLGDAVTDRQIDVFAEDISDDAP